MKPLIAVWLGPSPGVFPVALSTKFVELPMSTEDAEALAFTPSTPTAHQHDNWRHLSKENFVALNQALLDLPEKQREVFLQGYRAAKAAVVNDVFFLGMSLGITHEAK